MYTEGHRRKKESAFFCLLQPVEKWLQTARFLVRNVILISSMALCPSSKEIEINLNGHVKYILVRKSFLAKGIPL